MRILHLTPGAFDKGGISRYSRYQISALREICGSDNVRVLSLLGPNDDSLEEPFAVTWHGGSRPGTVSHADRISIAVRACTQAFTWRPDLIVSAHVNFGTFLTQAGRLAGARTLLNVYGLEIWSGLSAARQQHMARTDHILADCHFTARYVSDERLHADAPTVIWDPVDLERFTPGPPNPAIVAKYGLPDPAQHLIVMSLGRLAKEAAHKGFDRLIPVVASLTGDLTNIHLVIAGRGKDRERLEGIAAAQGISDRVTFTGSVDEADLPDLYRCADIFSLVSDRGHGRGEGIPLTPLEAMACGAPVIVGNEDGSQEAVVDNRNGRIVSPRDAAAHGAEIRTLAADRSALQALRREARAVAEECFSYTSFIDKHRALLDRLLVDKSAAA